MASKGRRIQIYMQQCLTFASTLNGAHNDIISDRNDSLNMQFNDGRPAMNSQSTQLPSSPPPPSRPPPPSPLMPHLQSLCYSQATENDETRKTCIAHKLTRSLAFQRQFYPSPSFPPSQMALHGYLHKHLHHHCYPMGLNRA